MKNKKKIEIGDMKETLTEVAALALPEFVDPIIVSDPMTLVTKISQKVAGHFLFKFFDEYKQRSKNKEIKNTNFKTVKPLLSFNEAVRIINGGKVDDDKFIALKSIFFVGISKDSNENDEFWSYEFLNTLNSLSGTEILILKANFDIAKGKEVTNVKTKIEKNINKFNRNAWMSTVASQMNLEGHNALVGKYESNLVNLGLISPPNSDNRFSADFEPTGNYRLTNTGYKFCEFMTKYEK